MKEEPSIFTVDLMNHIFKHLYFENVIMQCLIELNCFSKHATIWKSQKQPTSHSCPELNKTQFFPVSIVKVISLTTLTTLFHFTTSPHKICMCNSDLVVRNFSGVLHALLEQINYLQTRVYRRFIRSSFYTFFSKKIDE